MNTMYWLWYSYEYHVLVCGTLMNTMYWLWCSYEYHVLVVILL